jgi:DNA-binding IclR family transcriptional regulator
MAPGKAYYERIRPEIAYKHLTHILDFLKTEGGWCSTRNIRVATKITNSNAKIMLQRLAEAGIVEYGERDWGKASYRWWRLIPKEGHE